jgi:hypothetical protein
MGPVRFHSRPAVRRPSPPERHAACVALIKPAGYENDPWGGHISRGKTTTQSTRNVSRPRRHCSQVFLSFKQYRDNSASRMKASPGRPHVEVGKVRTRGHGERLSIKPTRDRPSPDACVAAKVRPIPQGFVRCLRAAKDRHPAQVDESGRGASLRASLRRRASQASTREWIRPEMSP